MTTLTVDQVPMPQEYSEWQGSLEDVWIANDVENHYITKHYLGYLDRNSSAINLRLIVGDKFVGSLIIISHGKITIQRIMQNYLLC